VSENRRIRSTLVAVTLKMKALWSFETSGSIYHSTRHNIPEDLRIHLKNFPQILCLVILNWMLHSVANISCYESMRTKCYASSVLSSSSSLPPDVSPGIHGSDTHLFASQNLTPSHKIFCSSLPSEVDSWLNVTIVTPHQAGDTRKLFNEELTDLSSLSIIPRVINPVKPSDYFIYHQV
jgi:hypothetical protein